MMSYLFPYESFFVLFFFFFWLVLVDSYQVKWCWVKKKMGVFFLDKLSKNDLFFCLKKISTDQDPFFLAYSQM